MNSATLGYAIPDLAKAAGTSRSALYEEIRAGRLKAKKFGSRTIITADEARRWLDSLPDLKAEATA